MDSPAAVGSREVLPVVVVRQEVGKMTAKRISNNWKEFLQFTQDLHLLSIITYLQSAQPVQDQRTTCCLDKPAGAKAPTGVGFDPVGMRLLPDP